MVPIPIIFFGIAAISVFRVFIGANTFTAEVVSHESLSKSSAFAYDAADYYEDVAEDLTEQYDSGIHFKPTQLKYENSPICIPSISQFEIHNVLDHSVDILAISSADPQFHPILFQPAILGPESHIVVQVLFLPYFLDASTAEFTIETSEGSLAYTVSGAAVLNPYRLHPFVGNKVIIGSSNYQIPVIMFNPHGSTLHIMEVFTTEDFISLQGAPASGAAGPLKPSTNATKTNTSVDMVWSISSGSEELVMTVSVSTAMAPGLSRGYVHVKTDHDKMIIPIEIDFVPGGLRLLEEVSFGVMSNPNEAKSVDIMIANDGHSNIKIVDVVIEGAGDGLTVVFNDSLMIFADRPYTKVATAVFRAGGLKVGVHVGKVVIYTNSSNTLAAVLDVPFRVTILHGGLGYDIDSLSYPLDLSFMRPYVQDYASENNFTAADLQDESLCIGHIQEVSFHNYYSLPIAMYTAQITSCNELVRLQTIPGEAVLAPLEVWGPVKLAFCMEKILHRYDADSSPKTCWMELQSNATTHRVPIYISDGRLEIEAIDTPSTSLSLDSFSVALGLLSAPQPRDLRIVLSNANSAPAFIGIANTSTPMCVCFESSWPMHYFNRTDMERFICNWSARSFASANMEKKRCSCHNSNSPNASSLQAKVRPGYSALLSIVLDDLFALPGVPGTFNDMPVLLKAANFTLRSRKQSIFFNLSFMLSSQRIDTVQDTVAGNGGHYLLGRLTPQVFLTTAAFPEEHANFILTADSALMDVRYSAVQPFHEEEALKSLALADRDARTSAEEVAYGSTARKMWKADVYLDVMRKPAARKCLEDLLRFPIADPPGMWALLLSIFCAVGRADKFTPQWIQAVASIERARVMVDISPSELRFLTLQLRSHWYLLHGTSQIDLPLTNLVSRSTAASAVFAINQSKLEIPIVSMPLVYTIRMPQSPLGQPVSIYLDMVNLLDTDMVIAFFRPESGFAFHYSSKIFCEDSLEDDIPLPLGFVFDKEVLTWLTDGNSSCKSMDDQGQCEEAAPMDMDCNATQCTVPADQYTDNPKSRAYLIGGAWKRSWNYQPSTVSDCFSPIRHNSLNTTIPKRSSKRVGPIVFTPDGNARDYRSSLLIYSSYSGFEQLDISVRTDKPLVGFDRLLFCAANDTTHTSCRTEVTGTSSGVSISGSDVALLYLRNLGNVSATIWDIEVDGVRCSANSRSLVGKGSGSHAPAVPTTPGERVRDECRYLPLRLKPKQSLPVQLSGLLTCSYLSRGSSIRVFDQHSKEPAVELALRIVASDAFIHNCLNGSNANTHVTVIRAVLIVMFVAAALTLLLLTYRWAMLWKAVNIPLAAPPAAAPRRYEDALVAARSALRQPRARSLSEDGPPVMDLSDVTHTPSGVLVLDAVEALKASRLQALEKASSTVNADANALPTAAVVAPSPTPSEVCISPVRHPLPPPPASPSLPFKAVVSPVAQRVKVFQTLRPLEMLLLDEDLLPAPPAQPLSVGGDLDLDLSPLSLSTPPWEDGEDEDDAPAPAPLTMVPPPGLQHMLGSPLSRASSSSGDSSPLFRYTGQLLDDGPLSLTPMPMPTVPAASVFLPAPPGLLPTASPSAPVHAPMPLPSEDIFVSQADRLYLQGLMSSTGDGGEFGRSWDQILADLDLEDAAAAITPASPMALGLTSDTSALSLPWDLSPFDAAPPAPVPAAELWQSMNSSSSNHSSPFKGSGQGQHHLRSEGFFGPGGFFDEADAPSAALGPLEELE